MLLLTCATFSTFSTITSPHLINYSVFHSTSPHSRTLSSTIADSINPHSLFFIAKTPSYSTPTPTSFLFQTSKTISLSIYSVATVKTAGLIMTAVRITLIMILFSITISMSAILCSILNSCLLCQSCCN